VCRIAWERGQTVAARASVRSQGRANPTIAVRKVKPYNEEEHDKGRHDSSVPRAGALKEETP